jgi:UDP-2,4-diacetamido-2,4,6-trideoxy-beta-L-altropyranose hydrolase
MRCLALAQAWQDAGGHCFFVMAETTPAVERRLREENIEVEQLSAEVGTVEDAKETARLASRKNAAWAVIDGYRFGSAYQSEVKAAGFKLLFVDDNVHAATYSADLVLNQNLHATASLYAKREPNTVLLLGPRYAMLRREFRRWRDWQREIPAIGRKILVTMGGSDPDNLTIRAIEAIQQLSNPALETVVLVGGSNPHLRSVEAAIQKKKSSMRLITDAPTVGELMAAADVAITGAGTTLWEMCCLGLPSLLLVLAENQEGVAFAADKMGAACTLGPSSEVSASAIAGKLAELLNSSEKRTNQSEKGRNLVDGRGAERVAAFLSDLELRRTLESDCQAFWEWANDAEARAASFRCKAISWEDHKNWFRGKLVDPKAILYTATNRDGLPVGEVRYQIEGKRALLSINLSARFRNRGLGGKILAVATEKLFQECEVESIDAYVKPMNEVSLKLFAGAGFSRFGSEVIEGQEGIRFMLARSPSA